VTSKEELEARVDRDTKALIDASTGKIRTLQQADRALNYFEGIAIKVEWKLRSLDLFEDTDEYAYAVYWALNRRKDPDLTVDDVKNLDKSVVLDWLDAQYGEFAEDDEGKKSGESSTGISPASALELKPRRKPTSS
jgi:hypothetical protein